MADQMFSEIEKETGLIGLSHCPSTQEAMLRATKLSEAKDGKSRADEASSECDSEETVCDGSKSDGEADISQDEDENPEKTPGTGSLLLQSI